MTAIVLPPPPSWVTLDLDVTPPTLAVTVEAHIEPPDDLTVVVNASEELGPTSIEFIDSLGRSAQIGWTALTPTRITGIVGTTSFATGPGIVVVRARDTACNLTTVATTVTIDRARVFDATLTVTGAFDVTEQIDHAFEASTDVEGAFATTLVQEEPFAAGPLTVEPAFETELEITDGG